MNTMHTIKTFAFALILLALPALVAAQGTTTQTTLATAITTPSGTNPTPSNQVTLTSGTGVAVGSFLYMDGETMRVNSIANTPTFTVQRCYSGCNIAPFYNTHPVLTPVWVTNANSPATFTSRDPAGTCTPSNYAFLPIINTTNGRAWNCAAVTSSVNAWIAWEQVPVNNTSSRTAVVDANYTAKLTDYIIAYTSLTTNRNLTLFSASGIPGKMLIIKAEGATTVTGAIGSIVVVGNIEGVGGSTRCCGTQLASSLGILDLSLRLYSNGVTWFRW